MNEGQTPWLGSTIPVFRIFDEAKAKEFYVDFLDFKIDWEHRFGENFPLYMQVSRRVRDSPLGTFWRWLPGKLGENRDQGS